MMTLGGVAKYTCQNCKKTFFIKLMAGGYIWSYRRARLPKDVKCPQCGCKNVKPGLLSKILY